ANTRDIRIVAPRRDHEGHAAAPEPPPRTMDEALERFGPGPDGVEPLLSPAADASLAQPIRFHPPRRAATPAPRA
ncbi:hypothetical protein ACN4GJ_31535, partial [Burkholderia pseudomallei]